MSSSQTIPNDSLPSTIPKLDPTGANWAIFSIRFEEAMMSRRKWGHFDGTSVKPIYTLPVTQDQSDEIIQWEKDESTSRYMLSQKLPDSAVVRVRKFGSVAEKWKLVTEEYTRKGLFARADLHQSFMVSKSPRGVNVRRWLTDLGTKREELVTSGIDISDAEYRATILSSIPEWLRTYAAAIQASASVHDPTFEIEPDILSRMISEEADRVSRQREISVSTYQRAPRKEEGDVALAAAPKPQMQ